MSNIINRDPIDLVDLSITFSTSKIDRIKRIGQIKLLMPKNDFNILDTIIEIDIGTSFNSFNNSCLNKDFSQLCLQTFNQIKTRHKLIKYEKEFGRGIKKNYFIRCKKSKKYYIIPKKCQYEVHPAQIREGIRRILHKLIPSEIIGNHRNSKKIIKVLDNFLKTAKNEPFNLSNLVKNLNFESTLWIKDMTNESHQRIFTAKFVKWLFKFFIAIIEDVFYMSHIQGEKVFIFKDDWKKQTSDQLKLMKQRSVLQLIGPVTESTEIKNRLCFLPKRENLRPITIHKYEEEDEQLLRQIHALLKYLYQKNYQKEDKPFNETLIEIVKDYNCNSKRIFAVSCDITDAYGSILQGKLFDMVQKMFTTLPTNLKFISKVVKKIKKYQIITDDTNVLSYNQQKLIIVNKERLLKVLKNCIFQTQVIYQNNVYNINRGVTQGLMISGVLCSIYYTRMNMKYFATFKTVGNIFHYVDDYLYVSNHLTPAKEFLQIAQTGISEYNCTFKKSKLKHNLELEDSQIIFFLGWKMDFHPIKIVPQYNSTRHSLYYTSLNTGKFEYKFKRLASLKLNKLILTKKIMSSQQIFENIELIFQRQAERCFAFLSYLHNTQQRKPNLESIIKVNYYILHKIVNLTEWGKEEESANSNTLRYIMWRSFFNTFTKRYDIFTALTKTFKKMMRKYEKKAIVKLGI